MTHHNITPRRVDEDGNSTHNIMSTRVAQRMFDLAKKLIHQQKKEKGIAQLDWKAVFHELLFEFMTEIEIELGIPGFYDQLTHKEEKQLAHQFMTAFNQIEINDTLFEEIRNGNGLSSISKVAGEVDIWTAGDSINKNQAAKLVSGEIYRLLHQAIADQNLPTRCNEIVSDDKTAKIQQALEHFTQSNNAKAIVVAILDDKPGVLFKATQAINAWQMAKSEMIIVHVLPIRAMRGTHGKDQWPDIYPLPKLEAADFQEAADIVQTEATQHHIPREHTIAFIDFDGTMSDNRIVQIRHTHAMHTHVMKAIKLATFRHLMQQQKEKAKTRTELNQVVRANRDDIWDIYDRVIHPPDRMLKQVLGEMEEQLGVTLDQQTVASLEEIDTWLRNSGYLNPKYTSDDLRAELIQKFNTRIEDKKVYTPDNSYNGQTEFNDSDYYENPQRTKKTGHEKRIYELLLTDEERKRAVELAEKFEDNVLRGGFINEWSQYIQFKSGGIKSLTSLVEKLAREGGKSETTATKMHDLVRGRLEIDGDEYSSATAYEEMAYQINRILHSQGLREMIVCFQNYYQAPYRVDKDGYLSSPMQGFKIVFKLDDDIHYELQVQTRRAAAANALNHDTIYKEEMSLSEAQKEYIKKLSWAAHIMDVQDQIVFQELEAKKANENALRYYDEFDEAV